MSMTEIIQQSATSIAKRTKKHKKPIISSTTIVLTSKEPVCPRVELILKIIIILLIIFLGFIKSKPC